MKRVRYQSQSSTAHRPYTATWRQLLQFTISRRLQKSGIFARCPKHYIPLTVGVRSGKSVDLGRGHGTVSSPKRDRCDDRGVVWEGLMLDARTELHGFESFCNRRLLLQGGDPSLCASVPRCYWTNFSLYGHTGLLMFSIY
ncbi:hypothetical protein TNCV_3379001 [Trichonephila clavipes]|nr:hypothetical protein TNCV_3379001 [Trichonephila clavipes]